MVQVGASGGQVTSVKVYFFRTVLLNFKGFRVTSNL